MNLITIYLWLLQRAVKETLCLRIICKNMRSKKAKDRNVVAFGMIIRVKKMKTTGKKFHAIADINLMIEHEKLEQ